MNDVDELIRQELAKDAGNMDEYLRPQPGMIGMGIDAFKGSLGPWVWIVAISNIVAAGFMFWTGYKFWLAETVDERMFWGIWLVAITIVGTSLKYWSWMEMNRVSIQKEVTRLELALLSLKSAIGK